MLRQCRTQSDQSLLQGGAVRLLRVGVGVVLCAWLGLGVELGLGSELGLGLGPGLGEG